MRNCPICDCYKVNNLWTCPKCGYVGDKPTATEKRYMRNGYVLPPNWSWQDVHTQRAKWHVDDRFVPLAFENGAVAWGVYTSEA